MHVCPGMVYTGAAPCPLTLLTSSMKVTLFKLEVTLAVGRPENKVEDGYLKEGQP